MRLYYKNLFIELDPWRMVSPERVAARYGIYGSRQRIYADGKTEKIEWKTGEVRLNEPSKVAYNTRNIGKSALALYVVVLKQAK